MGQQRDTVRSSPDGSTQMQETFGRYRLLGLLGQGGMGRLYIAERRGVQGFVKIVALKRILPHLADSGRLRDMFLNEARIAARLEHPNIVATYELGEVDGQYFISMEYLPGEDLSVVVSRCQGLQAIPVEIAAALAQQAGAPVKLEFSRKEDFIGMHGRWPTVQYYKVGVNGDGALQAIQLRGYSGMGPYRKNSGRIGGIEIYRCPNIESVIYPVYTNKTVSGNFRGPEFPQGFFGIQNMMDDVAYGLNMDPVDFVLKNMTRKANDQQEYTNYSLDECIRRGVEAFEWKKRWRPKPGSDAGPVKRGAGMSFMAFRSGVGRSNAIIQVDGSGQYWVRVGVTDVGAGAKTTMGLIAAEALDVPLSRINVIWGDTDQCPYSVGESGSRTTIMTGTAVIEAARDLKRQIAAKGMPKGAEVLAASAHPNPVVADNKVRATYGAHFVEVEVDTETGRVRVLKYLAVHDCGRIMNPLSATGQIKGGATMGIGMALHEELLYDPRSGQALTAGYYGHRVLTHRDAPEIEVIFLESDDGYGAFGSKSMGESSKVPAVAAVGNAIFNAIGRRMKDLPITRSRILGALAGERA